MVRASVAIFQKQIEYPEESRPYVPDEVFEAASRVAINKSCELVKSSNGLYVVKYSETGPWQERTMSSDYLPVWIARISSWCSGGITNSEMTEYLSLKEKN
jgi:hypothetical protein